MGITALQIACELPDEVGACVRACVYPHPRVPVPACTCYVRVFLRTSRERPCVCVSALLHDSTVASMKPSGTENNEWLERRKCSLFSSSLELTLRSIRHRRWVLPRRSSLPVPYTCNHSFAPASRARALSLSLSRSLFHEQTGRRRKLCIGRDALDDVQGAACVRTH